MSFSRASFARRLEEILPELPEVETIRRGLAGQLAGKEMLGCLTNAPALRYSLAGLSEGLKAPETLTRIDRRGKYMLFHFSGGQALIVHLGMSGSFRVEDEAEGASPLKHDHVVFNFEGGRKLIYHDPRRFGFIELAREEELGGNRHLKKLGIEPLSNHLSGESLVSLYGSRARPLKNLMLDQSLVAGLGNIYVSEALHRAGILPSRPGDRLSGKEAEDLSQTIRSVLEDALASGGSTLRDYRNLEGKMGYFQHEFDVYGREGLPCRKKRCKGAIEKSVMQGRSTFFCRACQV